MIKIYGLEQHIKHALSVKIEAGFERQLDLLGTNITLSFHVDYYENHIKNTPIEGVIVEFFGKQMAAYVTKKGEVFNQLGGSNVNISIVCNEENRIKEVESWVI